MGNASFLCGLSDAAGDFIHDHVVVRGVPAQEAAEAEDRIVFLRLGQLPRRERNFEGAGNAN